LYLVPTHELIDCERRAFFVNHSGFKPLQNVKVVIKDNKSGVVLEDEDFRAGIEPGPQDPDAPRYIWVKPSRPWDEDYTITFTAMKFHSVQNIVLRGTGKTAQLATQVTLSPKRKPVASCRDSLLPETLSLALGSRKNCDTLMAVDSGFLSKLKPDPFGLQRPDGNYTIVKMRKLPTASNLDAQSGERHLAEYSRAIMKSRLSKYRGTKLNILYAGGPKTLAYATEFRDFFRSMDWRVDGPTPAPVEDQYIVDVQFSVSQHYWNSQYPRGLDLLESLEGVKHRQQYIYDDAVASDVIVLWVGPESPGNFRPDDCAPVALHPRPGDPQPCESIAQTTAICPFIQ
jgi:hypothetical protein